MKKLIRNQYIDFSTISSIEVSNFSLFNSDEFYTMDGTLKHTLLMNKTSLNTEMLVLKSVLGAPNIQIKRDFLKTTPIIFPRFNSEKKSEIEKMIESNNYIVIPKTENSEKKLYFYKIEEENNIWENEKQYIVDLWEKSESCLKHI